jgi:hypothetical protein
MDDTRRYSCELYYDFILKYLGFGARCRKILKFAVLYRLVPITRTPQRGVVMGLT